eukprot:290561_1
MAASSWTLAILLNVGGNFISSLGWILQKKQHEQSSQHELESIETTTEIDIISRTSLQYVIAWRWWLGFLCYGGGSAVASISYTYGPQSLLIPLETIILVFNIILGAKFLNERMFVKDYIGITLIFVGVVISVVAAPKEQQEEEYTIHELMHLFTQSSFWTFITCYTVIVFIGYLLYKVPRLYQYVASTDANIFLIIFINLSAYFGSWNAILLKSVLEIMASSFGGKATQNFEHFATYLLFIGFVGSILMLEFWRQKALALYVSTYVLAVYRVFVTTAGVLFGAFYWNDFVGTKGVYIGIYVLAILLSFVGVAVITFIENINVFGRLKESQTKLTHDVENELLPLIEK